MKDLRLKDEEEPAEERILQALSKAAAKVDFQNFQTKQPSKIFLKFFCVTH